ncbi:MAG: RagB/SusD family nutrient uptake outer membrane protein [Lewinellaceae bacterium]|nr:RagB/SusD family nutrient uptake outer membrane protein [Lewinellaceae bacterium]
MKKLHNLKYLFIAVLILGFNQSCTNLDEELFDTVTGDNFFKTDEEFIAALGAAYTRLYSIGNHGGYMSSNEVASDEAMIPQRGQDWFDGGVWLRQHQHTYNLEEGQLNGSWGDLYGSVSTCNRLIAQFEQLANPATDPFIAELKVLRGYFYWQLLDMFGNIPVITSFADADPNPPTVPRKDVYNFLVQDLEKEVAKLPKTIDGTTYGRMQYYAGKTLLAKLYLNAEIYSGTPEWAKAEAACDEVINSGVYSLESDYFTNFNTNNSGSSENILSVPYDEVFAEGFNLPMMTLHYTSQATWNFTDQPWNGWCTMKEFYNSYDDSDKRKGVWGSQKVRGNFLAGPQYASDGVTRLIDDGAEAADPDGKPVTFTPELNELFPNALRQAGVRIGKFEFKNGGRTSLSNDFPIFRYADVLLMKAEAQWRQNASSATALALVNQVRARAGVPDFTELTADNLLAERGREMFYENHRRTDLIRFGQYNKAWEFKPASQPFRNIYPIPRAQLDANPNLAQNPGY